MAVTTSYDQKRQALLDFWAEDDKARWAMRKKELMLLQLIAPIAIVMSAIICLIPVAEWLLSVW